jgi:hypothetical protein
MHPHTSNVNIGVERLIHTDIPLVCNALCTSILDFRSCVFIYMSCKLIIARLWRTLSPRNAGMWHAWIKQKMVT